MTPEIEESIRAVDYEVENVATPGTNTGALADSIRRLAEAIVRDALATKIEHFPNHAPEGYITRLPRKRD